MVSQRESSWVLLSQDANKRPNGTTRMQASLSIGEQWGTVKGRKNHIREAGFGASRCSAFALRARRGWPAHDASLFPSLGEEPLWRISRHPSSICPNASAAERREKEQLPGASQRDEPAHGLDLLSRTRRAAKRYGRSREPPVGTFCNEI
jgi:hypothetical protein